MLIYVYIGVRANGQSQAVLRTSMPLAKGTEHVLITFPAVTEPCHLAPRVSNLLSIVNIQVRLKSPVPRPVRVISVTLHYNLKLCHPVNYKRLLFRPD